MLTLLRQDSTLTKTRVPSVRLPGLEADCIAHLPYNFEQDASKPQLFYLKMGIIIVPSPQSHYEN